MAKHPVLRRLALVGLVVAAVFVGAIQFIPIDRSHPEVGPQADLKAPAAVKVILKRACYDCHSFETRWPWYARIAPLSLVIQHHVQEGREKLNFSTWETRSSQGKTRKAHALVDSVEDRSMPPWDYRLMHPEAALGEGDVATLKTWSQALAAKP